MYCRRCVQSTPLQTANATLVPNLLLNLLGSVMYAGTSPIMQALREYDTANRYSVYGSVAALLQLCCSSVVALCCSSVGAGVRQC